MKMSFLLLLTLTSTAASASYEPFAAKCSYEVQYDGKYTLNTQADPAEDDLAYTVYSHSLDEIEQRDFESVYIYKLDDAPELQARFVEMAQVANVNLSEVFTITEFTLFNEAPDGPTMVLYKFNGQSSTLGYSIYTEVSGFQSKVICE